jgi:type I restriction enzyme, S subunit
LKNGEGVMSREGWKTYKLEDIAVFYDSKRVPLNSRERESRKGIYPYYGASGVVDYINDYLFDGEYVLISEDGENLRSRTTPIAFKASGKFWVNNHAHVVKGNESFLDSWIIYYLQNMDLSPYITGAVQPKLNKENLQLIDILLPSFEEAKKIVSILSALDDKIELNRQTNTTLEAIAQAIFKEWFVDFRFPGATGEMQDSELGPIPKGWRIGQLGEMCEFGYGKGLKSANRVKGKFPVVGSNGIVGFHNKCLVKGPGIVIGRKGTIGEVAWIHNDFFPIDTTFYIKDLLGVKALFFHYFLLKEQDFKKIGSDSAVPGLNRNQAYDNLVVIPTNEAIGQFNDTVQSIFDNIFNIGQESKFLAQIRDSLLPKLLSGEISMEGVE